MLLLLLSHFPPIIAGRAVHRATWIPIKLLLLLLGIVQSHSIASIGRLLHRMVHWNASTALLRKVMRKVQIIVLRDRTPDRRSRRIARLLHGAFPIHQVIVQPFANVVTHLGR